MRVWKKICAALLILVTLVGVCAVPVAAYSYPMAVTIYYKDEAGNQLYKTFTGSLDASNPTSTFPSPTIEGYLLKNNGDAVVTYAMMDKYFPPSNYVRNGSCTYTVYYVKEGHATVGYRYFNMSGMAAPTKTITGREGNYYTITSPTVPGYTPNKTSVSGTLKADNPVVYVYYTENLYTILYDPNGGTGAPDPQTKKYTKDLTLSDKIPTKTGYDFVGWSTVPNAATASYAPGGIFKTNEDTTLYAVWKQKTYTVTYDANGGSGAPTAMTKYYGTPLKISTDEPTRDGYAFMGWSTNSNATTASFAPGSNYTVNANLKLYAVWDKVPSKYFVVFNANGGTGAPATQTKTEGIPLTLSRSVPTRTGYTFLGWSSASNSTTIEYSPGERYSTDATLRLYAVWKANTYTVSFNANGGSGGPTSQTKTHSVTLTLPWGEPTRAHYDFVGWATSSSASAPNYYPGGDFTSDANTTLYAVWRARNYDFSVSDLKVNPTTFFQYETTSVSFRVDSWDQQNAYSNIPITVLLNNTVVYSTTVSFSPFGVQFISFDYNVGNLEGTQTLTARINWSDHLEETDSSNNQTSASFTVESKMETSVGLVSTEGDYYVGEEVVSTFSVGNESSTSIYPSDHLRADFEVYTYENGDETVIYSASWNDVVIPANKSNLVYFKWTVPTNMVGKTCWVRCTANRDHLSQERDKANNSKEFAIVPQSRDAYTVPNTRYEEKAPADYNANASAPTVHNGSATWSMWEYADGSFVLHKYGIRVGLTNVTLTPDSNCASAKKVDGVWHMKSGYGFAASWYGYLTSVSGYGTAPADSYTNIQSVVAMFPEYGYDIAPDRATTMNLNGTYYKLPVNVDAGSERVHFIPIYVQDGDYTVSVKASGIWTPAGYLYSVRNSNVLVVDGTVYDDWYNG